VLGLDFVLRHAGLIAIQKRPQPNAVTGLVILAELLDKNRGNIGFTQLVALRQRLFAILETADLQYPAVPARLGNNGRLVFIVGLEEGLFPSQRSLDEQGKLEEERRLCYVGITRARKQLVVTSAEHRRLYGQDMYPMPSRFIGEIPEHLIHEVRSKPTVSQPLYSPRPAASASVNGIGVGQRVMHAKFGEGVVTNLEGDGAHARVEVNFEYAGSKWLVMAYANLQPVG